MSSKPERGQGPGPSPQVLLRALVFGLVRLFSACATSLDSLVRWAGYLPVRFGIT